MLKERIIEKMIRFSEGNVRDIDHFLKVYAYAETIAELEGLDEREKELTLVTAAVHDIACPVCREKYGKCPGHLQEIESEGVLRPFLEEFDIDESEKERIIYLVSHHHSPDLIDGIDFQIIIEADYLVNAGEMAIERNVIESFGEAYFRTSSGRELLKTIYLR